MEYIRPESPEKLIRLCFDIFTKEEAIKRTLDYIESIHDGIEEQIRVDKVIQRSIQNFCNSLSKKK